MFSKIRKFLGPKKLAEGNKIVVNCEKLETRVALLENGSLEEYTVERSNDENIVGSIFKGIVRNIEPGLNAMFVDIGLEKNAFLHFWDAIPEALDSSLEEIQRNGGKNRSKSQQGGGGKGKGRHKKKRIQSKDIPNLYPVGSEVLVQVTKGPIGTKGPRITTNISLPGRYMVLMPRNDQLGISRKIDDPKERARLRKIMSEKLTIPDKMGVILRTVSAGQKVRYFVRDLAILLDQWDEIEEEAANSKAPACVFREPDLIERTVRDFLTDEIDEVLCDDSEAAERMKELIGIISRRSKKRIQFFETPVPIFEKLGIQRQIDDAFFRQVWLPSGGYLVIDETEALIAIDVNTGRAKNQDKMILQTNLEAAEAVARQLRLRNIGGLVVIDFIDMRARRDQMAVYKVMRERLKKDKAKTQVTQISQLGLMEMTRQRLHESLNITINEPCHYCQGRGMIKSAESMSVELQRKLKGILAKNENQKELIVIVHPDVMERLRTHDGELFVELERRYNARLTFRSDATYYREQVVVADARTQKEIRD
ncbi:MAG: ribonuclease E/G [Verrucomicrobiales bacterium]|nr:ribonuclease E/G [Verrucomicrobiales bacterium]|tara:strand:- start:6600 stop:8213 length:1614 start_codon:yes stop_codon:yes gene_type:complete